MNLLSILLMTPTDGAEQGGFMSFLPLILIIVVFYFFFIRPQMKKGKEQRKFREELKKGDNIITLGGVHGKVLNIDDTTVIIETEGQGRLKVEKSAIVPQGTVIAQQK
ncbi:MAG: preprotein translocase subunit YajC [Bacteroidales bacterium]|jgi:preprotein translocase subunit YajC|nr:preprotein translocase subunit YajC [Bacteroidales bacterium]